MKLYKVHLDVGSALEAPRRCAGCGGRHLTAETGGELVSFVCQDCGLRWEPGPGWLSRAEAVRRGEDRCGSA
jgi:hypothetical protein